MFQRLILSASLVSLALLQACSSAPQNFALRNGMPVQGQSVFNRQSAGAVRNTDWFAQLSPELQQYYAPARGKTGRDLLVALHQIISQGQATPQYQDSKSFLYASADNTVFNNRTGLFDNYSYVFIPGKGGDGNIYREAGDLNQDGLPNDFINAEHTWPQSFFGKQMPMVADMHHIFPTLSKPNAMRNNFPIGMAEGTVVYTSNGSKLSAFDKTGRHTPAETVRLFNLPWEQQPHDVINNDFKVTFEPLDRQKGNSARALMYFYVRYYDQNIRQGGYNQEAYWNSKVPTYIAWAQADPVDELEAKRHQAAAQRQRNRNPFVDIPNLGNLIGAEALVNIR